MDNNLYSTSSMPKKNKNVKKIVLTIIAYFFLVALLLFFLFPFFFMLFKSFMADAESHGLPVRFFPTKFTLVAYQAVLDASLLRYFLNTVFVLVFNCLSVPLSASLCAYGFTRVKFKGSETIFGIVLATIMLPSIVIQIPLYVIFNSFGWIGTLYPLTIPNIFGGGAMNIFLICQFMRGIPKDIENSAKIDGASSFKIFTSIMVPLCMPIIIYIIINTFLGVWNDFMGPLIYLSGNPDNYTLAVGIYNKFIATSNNGTFPNQQMAVGVLMVIPPAILFFVFQRQLIEGVSFGALKG